MYVPPDLDRRSEPLLCHARDLWAGCRIRHPATAGVWWRIVHVTSYRVPVDVTCQEGRIRLEPGDIVEVHGRDFDARTAPWARRRYQPGPPS